MSIALRHVTDPAPQLTALPGMFVHQERSAATMAALQQRDRSVIEARFDAGHRAYVATVLGVPAAWGWVATSRATIGELETSFRIGGRERYLWNFVTLPAFRGLGIYPRLINAIVEAEARDADQFWIAYAPENHASESGIRKAGFTAVAELSFDGGGHPVVKSLRPGGANAASRLLGIPEAHAPVSQCWKCPRGPAPTDSSCATAPCCCDYQRAEQACAAT